MKLLIGLLLIFATHAGAQSNSLESKTDSQMCEPVLRLASHDENYYLWSAKQRQILYEHSCDNKNLKSGWDLDVDIGVIADIVDLGVGVGSKNDKMTSFCRDYNNNASADLFATGATRSVVREAIAAWKECIATNQHVNITMRQDGPRAFLIEMSRGAENVNFQGVRAVGGKLDCRSSRSVRSRRSGALVGTRVDDDSTLLLNDGTLFSVHCERVVEGQGTGRVTLPPVQVFAITDRGNLSVSLHSDQTGPDFKSQWTQERIDLDIEIARLKSRKIASRIVCGGGYGEPRVSPPACNADETVSSPITTFATKPTNRMGWSCTTCSKFVDSVIPR